MINKSFTVLFACLALCQVSNCLNNGLALTPPMGWMSWERYRCTTNCKRFPNECISEWLFKNVTDLMVSEGYKDVGYEYVIVDDCWLAKKRDKNGKLQPDPHRFPSGMKALADYIHSKGLKFGLYEDAGTKTCAGYPGVKDNMELDARTFSEWGVDYVKLDGCKADVKKMDQSFPLFGKYLNATGRPMVYSCSWPEYEKKAHNFTAVAEHCNLWRVHHHIQDSWSSVRSIMTYFARQQNSIAKFAGPGHWNDPDMLIIGNYGLSEAQAEAQMAVWAILAAPLIMSTDLANISPNMKAILQNKRVIAVNQDPLGIQGRMLHVKRNIEVWARPISPMYNNYYSYAVAFVSRRNDGVPYTSNIKLKELGLHSPTGYIVDDLFGNLYSQKLMMPKASLKVRIKPSGVVLLLFKVVGDLTPKPTAPKT